MTEGPEAGETFIAEVLARAEVDGSWASLAGAARSLAAFSEIELDERSLRLFTDPPEGVAAAPSDLLGPPHSSSAGARVRVFRQEAASASVAAGDRPTELPPWADPGMLGVCFEALLTGGQRSAGAHHTPRWVADRVVGIAVEEASTQRETGGASWASINSAATSSDPMPTATASAETGSAPTAGGRSVCDPAVGGGVFLLAAADHLHRRGLGRAEVLERLWGFDTDPLAVAVTEAALALWAGVASPDMTDRLIVGDFLDQAVEQVRPPGGWSLIVGNPPFQSQLAGRTARSRDRADGLRRRFGSSAGGYVDEAGLFVLAGVEHLAERGRLALILPASLLAAGDAEALRRTVTARAPICSVWVPDTQVFAAAVDVVVPVFERTGSVMASSGSSESDVTIVVGAFEPSDPGGPSDGASGYGRSGGVIVGVGPQVGPGDERAEPRTVPNPGSDWSALLADAEGVPRVHLDTASGRVEDLATVTAGFRQHFYGLADAVNDGEITDARPLMTVGLVDPLTSHWGRRTTRLAGTTYRSPVVDVDAIDDADVAAWVKARHRPKVLVATQTRAVEAVVDAAGTAVPSTPLISVEPHHPDDDLWPLAAVLCAPVVTAWFHRRGAGGGLSAGRIRPTAKLVRDIPLPTDAVAWARAAALARRASADIDPIRRHELLLELGAVMETAYATGPEVTSWWTDQLPQP